MARADSLLTLGLISAAVACTGTASEFPEQLGDSGGTLWLGGYDLVEAPHYTPMVAGAPHWDISIDRLAVGFAQQRP